MKIGIRADFFDINIVHKSILYFNSSFSFPLSFFIIFFLRCRLSWSSCGAVENLSWRTQRAFKENSKRWNGRRRSTHFDYLKKNCNYFNISIYFSPCLLLINNDELNELLYYFSESVNRCIILYYNNYQKYLHNQLISYYPHSYPNCPSHSLRLKVVIYIHLNSISGLSLIPYVS